MKQFWKKGIVALIMIAIFLAPVSGGIKNKTVSAQDPADYTIYKNILTESSAVWQNSSQTVAEFLVNIQGPQTDWDKAAFANFDSLTGSVSPKLYSVVLTIMENGNFVSSYDFSPMIAQVTKTTGWLPWTHSLVGPSITNQYVIVGGLTAGKNYTAEFYYTSTNGAGGGINLFTATNKNYYKFGKSVSFSTPKEGEQIIGNYSVTPPKSGTNTPGGGLNLGCSLEPWSPNLTGCIAGIFYMVWEVSAVIAKFAGTFLDFFVYYSTNSSSYTNEFVSQGWGAVRDIANIFFIIALLYVAIKTILNLNVTDNKKLIGTIIIVALIINFSLFTTKIVIDASNILAKVFYNNIISKDEKEALATGASGQKSISIGLIEKYDPQAAFNNDNNGQKRYDESPGTFIFITIFLIAITLYTAYIFFSVALLFVARVVSLWLAMIFSPIAFASYTVPFEIPGFGHKEWWKNLLDNALLAPVFIFILYIVILFADFLKTITDNTDSLLTVAIPFIILAVLLREGKKLAIKYSGEIGAGIVKAGAILGGLAIGGTAMGVAAVGRGTAGAFMKGASTGDTAARRLAAERAPGGVRDVNLTRFQRLKGNLATITGVDALQQMAGRRLNADQHNVEHAARARHELDTATNSVFTGKKWEELNGQQRYEVRRQLARDRVVRENSGNTLAAAGAFGHVPGLGAALGTRKWEALSQIEKDAIDMSADVGNDPVTEHAIPGHALANNTTRDDVFVRDARRKQGTLSSVIQSGVTGGYDIRDLSKLVAREQTTGFTKLTTGLTAAIASGMRGGLKGALNINYGEGQKNFFKDLGHTIGEAMKGAKINVDLSHVGEQKKEGDKSGGHH